MKLELELSAITGIPVYSSRHVAPGQAYAISLRGLIHPDTDTVWGQAVTNKSTPLTIDMLINQWGNDVQRNRRWVPADARRYAIEHLGITDADIRDVREAWLSDHLIVRLWNRRRIRIARRDLAAAGRYVTLSPFVSISLS